MALKRNPYRKRTPPLRHLAPHPQPVANSPSPNTTTTSSLSLSPVPDPHAHLPPPPPCGIQNLPSGTLGASAWRLPLPGDEVLEQLRESGFALRPSNGNNIVLPEAEVWGRLVGKESPKKAKMASEGEKRHRPAVPLTCRSVAPSPATAEVAKRMNSAFPQASSLLPQLRVTAPRASLSRPRGSPPVKPNPSQPPVSAFLSALTIHYARRNDKLSPAFFAKLCLDYNSKAIDELSFYVGVLRLLLSSGAGHLVETFRPLLPAAWRKSDLTWLTRGVEEDVKFQMGIARARFAVIAGGSLLRKRLASADAVTAKGCEDVTNAVKACARGGPVRKGDSLVIVLRVPKGDLRAKTEGHQVTAAAEEAASAITVQTNGHSSPAGLTTTQEAASKTDAMGNQVDSTERQENMMPEGEPAPVRRKKKVPRNGYRAVQVSHLVGIDESSSSAVTPTANSPIRATSPPGKPSLVVVLSPTATRTAPTPEQPPAKKVKTGKTALPAPAKQPTPVLDVPPAKKVKTRKTALPAPVKQPTPPANSSPTPSSAKQQPRASTPLPSASTIPHKGSIYPTRRAILSRASKPYIHTLCGVRFMHPEDVKRHHVGQGGRPGCWEKMGEPKGRAWDEDASCKVKLPDVKYRQCREGWVVTDWGDVGRVEGVVEGVAGGETEVEGSKAKTNTVARKRKARDDVSDADEGSESEDVAEATERAPEKRQRTEDDVVRAVALGLRTGK